MIPYSRQHAFSVHQLLAMPSSSGLRRNPVVAYEEVTGYMRINITMCEALKLSLQPMSALGPSQAVRVIAVPEPPLLPRPPRLLHHLTRRAYQRWS